MLSLRRVAACAAVATVAVLWTGCAATRPSGEGSPEGELPAWVRAMKPLTADGRANYIGSVAIAVDAESGLEEAEFGARLQIEDAARERFLDIYDLVRREIAERTTPVQRFDYQNLGAAAFFGEMASTARRDTFYYRPCGGANAPASGPVCSVFVLVSVDMKDWDRRVVTLLEELRRRVAAVQDTTLAEITDLAIRRHETEFLSRQREEEAGGRGSGRSSHQQ